MDRYDTGIGIAADIDNKCVGSPRVKGAVQLLRNRRSL